MNRLKDLPLTETVYYILLALLEPAHGYVIMQKVEELSEGQVRLAAGTLYGAIDNLVKSKWIQQLPSDDARRKVYMITDLGKSMMLADYDRMNHMLKVTYSKLTIKGEA